MKYLRRNKEDRQELINKANELRADGMSWNKISSELGLSHGTLSYWREHYPEQFISQKNKTSVTVHNVTTEKRTYTKKPKEVVSDRAIVIVTTTNNLTNVLRQI